MALDVQRIQPAYVQVADQIRALIVRGDLPSGSRLPPEANLATLFGVSRSTVREALRLLSSQNLVTTSRGVTGGSFVAQPDVAHIEGQLEVGLGLLSPDTIGVDELLEARTLLEVPAARMAANHRTASHVELLRAAMHANTPGRLGHIAGHQEFHDIVLRAAGNRLLELMTRPVFKVLQSRTMGDAASPEFWETVNADHQRILNAIAARDAERAARQMFAHLEHLRPTYARVYTTTSQSDPASESGAVDFGGVSRAALVLSDVELGRKTRRRRNSVAR